MKLSNSFKNDQSNEDFWTSRKIFVLEKMKNTGRPSPCLPRKSSLDDAWSNPDVCCMVMLGRTT